MIDLKQILEPLSWAAAIFGVALTFLVTIDQLGVRLRRRNSVDFWQREISASNTASDEHTLRMLKRQDLSKVIAAAWIPVRFLYIRIGAGIFGLLLAWLSAFVAANLVPGAIESSDLRNPAFWIFLLVMFSYILLQLFLVASAVAGMLAFAARRAWIRQAFLAGQMVDPILRIHGAHATLREIAGVRVVMFSIGISISGWGAAAVIGYVRGILAAGYVHAVSFTVFLALIFLTATGLVISVLLLEPFMKMLQMNTLYFQDLHPPHGVSRTPPRKLAWQIRREQENQARQGRRAPWERR